MISHLLTLLSALRLLCFGLILALTGSTAVAYEYEDRYMKEPYQEPVDDDPGYQEDYEAPVYDDSGYQEPADQVPVYQEETYQEEVYEEPQYEQQEYQEPTYQEEVYQEDVYQEEPEYQEPAQDNYQRDQLGAIRTMCQQYASESGLEGEEAASYVDECVFSQTGY